MSLREHRPAVSARPLVFIQPSEVMKHTAGRREDWEELTEVFIGLQQFLSLSAFLRLPAFPATSLG